MSTERPCTRVLGRPGSLDSFAVVKKLAASNTTRKLLPFLSKLTSQLTHWAVEGFVS